MTRKTAMPGPIFAQSSGFSGMEKTPKITIAVTARIMSLRSDKE
jgi:hypothetical protein